MVKLCLRTAFQVMLTAALFSETARFFAQQPARPAEAALVARLNRAMALAEQGHEQQALTLAEELVVDHPDFVPALKLQGALLEEEGRASEAEQVYRKALQLTPNDASLLFKLGTNRLAAGDNTEAASFFVRYLRLTPSDGVAFFYLAQAYHLSGQDDLALKASRRSAELLPGKAEILQEYGEMLCATRDRQTGLKQLLKAQQLNPALRKIDFDIALAHFDEMDYSNTVRYASKAVQAGPEDLDALRLLSEAHVELSQWPDAQGVFEKILALKKDDPSALLGTAHCMLELKHFEKAIATLHRVLELDPSQAIAHFYMSRAFLGLGQTDDARHEAEIYRLMDQMSIAPPTLGSEGGKTQWDRGRQLLREGHEAEALSAFQDGVKAPAASLADAYVLAGSVYLSIDRMDAGVRALRHALEIKPTVRGAHTYLGLDDLQWGRLIEAESEFEAELAVDPNYLTALAGLGEVRYRQERWAEAADLLLKSRTKVPAQLYMLCDALFKSGRGQEADVAAEALAGYAASDRSQMQALVDLLHRQGETALASKIAAMIKPE
jgi:tetratricopeptide (TPR) repeat protein